MEVSATGTWQIQEMLLTEVLDASRRYGLSRAVVEEMLLDGAQQIGTIRALRGDCLYATVEWALAELGSDAFLATATGAVVQNDQSALGLALRASTTLGDALGRICRYEAFWTTTVDLVLEPQGDELVVSCSPQGSRRQGRRAMLAYLVAGVLLNLQAITGLKLSGVRVEVGWDPDQSRLPDVLQTSVVFGAAGTRLVLPQSYATLALPHGYGAFADYFDRDVVRLLDGLHAATGVEQLVAGHVLRCVNAGTPVSLGDTAQALGQSSRSLQR